MKKLLGVILLASVFTVIARSEPAQAGSPGIHPFGGLYYGLGNLDGLGSFGRFSSPYATGQVPTPPYFALHPPVYYSHAVPRTYGYSPFAYPGIYTTPEVVESEAQVIENPHVEEPVATPEASLNITARREPLEIVNPYVPSNQTRLASYTDDAE